MWKELVFSAKYVLGTSVAGRLAPAPNDAVFLVSFPKSGNTWVRFLVGNLTHPEEPVTFANVDRIIPDIYGAGAHQIRAAMPPRVFKSHEAFDPRYRRVIYIVRDPRDVAVSSYHFLRKGRQIEDKLPLETYISTLFLGRKHAYGNWGEHVGSWLANASNVSQWRSLCPAKNTELGARGHGRQFLLLRYEDLLENTEGELSKVAEFLGRTASLQDIQRAVASSLADKMKKLEQKQSDQWSTTREGRKDINFVREARSGQWKLTLPPASVAEIESTWGHLMRPLGYGCTAEQ
jgi:hypothetical protein